MWQDVFDTGDNSNTTQTLEYTKGKYKRRCKGDKWVITK
jgi:hypothetical protein